MAAREAVTFVVSALLMVLLYGYTYSYEPSCRLNAAASKENENKFGEASK